MEKVIRPWCGQPSDRGRLKNRTERGQMSGIGGGAYVLPSADMDAGGCTSESTDISARSAVLGV